MALEIITTTAALFAIVDPFSAIPTFMTLFGKAKPKVQKKAAMDIGIAAFVIMAVFALVGNALLRGLGISIPAFMIAGGILLMVMSFDFLIGHTPKTKHVEAEDPADAVVPIGTPLLAGPGAITTCIFFSQIYGFVTVLISVAIVSSICFFLLFYGVRIARFFGKNGLKILTRIMGLFIAAIAISLMEKAFITYGILKPLTGV